MPNHLAPEKLDVYQLELQFVAWSTELMAELLVSSEAKARGPVLTFAPGF